MSSSVLLWIYMPLSERSRSSDHYPGSQDTSLQPSPALQDTLARLEQAVGRIHDSETFRAYLAAQARFHTYSWGNVLLILAQRPDATRVAGFHTWKQLERHVLKGEHGLKIVVPFRYSRLSGTEAASNDPFQGEQDVEGAAPTQARPTDPDLSDARRLHARRFGIGTVFDISQTDGKPLPAIDVPVLDGDAGEDLYRCLEGVATEEQLTVERGNSRLGPATMGFYSQSERRIVLREAPTRQMTKTLAHELAHHCGGATAPSPEEETTAESVAYVVCARFGLDTGERSFPYVATWSQDQRVFRAALNRIQRLSHRLIESVERQDAGLMSERSHVIPGA